MCDLCQSSIAGLDIFALFDQTLGSIIAAHNDSIQERDMKSISLKLLVSSAIACMPCVVAAQTAGPITVVVPFGPGAGADVMMRLVTSKVTHQTQQQVIVENKPGAPGIIGAEQVKNANSQNPVLFQSSIGTHGVNPPLFGPKLPYDAVKDFKSVGMLWRFPSVLAVPTQSGI